MLERSCERLCWQLTLLHGRAAGRALFSRGGLMKRHVFLVFGLWFLFVPLCAYAQEASAQKGEKIITTDELKKMYDAGKDFLLINTLSPIEYAEERIKGSVNIPYSRLKNGMAKLTANKN